MRIQTVFKLFLFVALSVFSANAHAGGSKVEAVIAVDKETKPATTFNAKVSKLYAFFRSNGTHEGDKLRAVWIAVDVGDAAPKNFKIDEASLTADQDNFYGAFSLSKPNKGWPVGQYRVDIYQGDELATSAKFSIKSNKAKDEESDDESSDDDSSD